MSDDRGPQLEAVVISLLVLSIIATSLRCYTMGCILKRFFIEDWLAVLALVLYCVYSAAALEAIRHGLGRHVEAVPPEHRPMAVMWRWVASLLYIAISTLTKFVVGLFLLRICSHRRWQRRAIWAIMGTVAAFNSFYFFVALLACRPLAYEWTRYATPAPGEGECNSSLFATVPTYASALLNVVADWALPMLPAAVVWRARLDRRTRLSVCAVLALGSIASVATIVRLPYARGLLDQPDYLYHSADIGLWSTVEIGVALIASSLATLKPLFRRLRFLPASQQDGDPYAYSGATGASAGLGMVVVGRGRDAVGRRTPEYLRSGTFVEISAGPAAPAAAGTPASAGHRDRQAGGRQKGRTQVEMAPRRRCDSASRDASPCSRPMAINVTVRYGAETTAIGDRPAEG